jgi:hypothetical protein
MIAITDQSLSRMNSDWRLHLLAPLALAPFAVMVTIHWWFGLSDAMMVMPEPDARHWPFFNMFMVLSLGFGVIGYLAFSFVLSNQGVIWIFLKLSVLATAYAVFLAFFCDC